MWKKVSSKLSDVESDTGFLKMFLNWIVGVILVYSILFGTGKLIFGEITEFLMYLAIAIVSVIIIYFNLSKIGWQTLSK